MVLSGGLSYDTVGRRACLTVMHGKSTTVLEMDFPIVDFLTLCETPYPNGELQKCKLVFRGFFFSFLFKYLPFQDVAVCSSHSRFPGTVCCGGPAGEGFSRNRSGADRVTCDEYA